MVNEPLLCYLCYAAVHRSNTRQSGRFQVGLWMKKSWCIKGLAQHFSVVSGDQYHSHICLEPKPASTNQPFPAQTSLIKMWIYNLIDEFEQILIKFYFYEGLDRVNSQSFVTTMDFFFIIFIVMSLNLPKKLCWCGHVDVITGETIHTVKVVHSE